MDDDIAAAAAADDDDDDDDDDVNSVCTRTVYVCVQYNSVEPHQQLLRRPAVSWRQSDES